MEKHTNKSKVTIVRNTFIMFALLSVSMLVGTVGYRFTGNFSWMDSFLNAAMILTGMGPVHDPVGNGGKFFSAMFALYSGIVFLSSVAIFIFPILQHLFSSQSEDDDLR